MVSGFAALLPAACGVDRDGLGYDLPDKDAATNMRGETGGGTGGDELGGSGGVVDEGTGGLFGGSGGIADEGTGGLPGGSGGAPVAGTGGVFSSGTGGNVNVGSGGAPTGTGGMIVRGTGGVMVAGTGGAGTGGAGAGGAGAGGAIIGGLGGAMKLGTGGLIELGTGGMNQPGSGGMIVGTGGAPGGTGGMPTTGCSAGSCQNGCCAGNQCITALTAAQCGHAGAACQPCAGCERCSTAGACELDPASQWDLVAASAVLNRNDPYYTSGTGPWDLTNEQYGGARPDPFCELEMPVGTPIYGTDTIVDTLTPAWNQPLNAPATTLTASDLLPNGMSWQAWVGDDDGNGLGEVMCEINGPIMAADFKAGGFMRANVGSQFSTAPSCTSVTFKLVCHP